MRLTSTPYANADGRVPLNDLHRDAQPPPDMDEQDPAGCTLFMVPVIIFTVAGIGWWFGF